VSLIRQSGHTSFREGLSFQKFLFSGAKEKTREERFLIRKKSSRAIRVILYTRILARILLHAQLARKQIFLFL
jgi:hypothetical protein